MNHRTQPLIVGAGPVGMGAALFLARAGVALRIVDAAAEPSRQSKALAVNPRTLEILEPTGITEKMLALGLPIRGVRFWAADKPLAELSLKRLRHKYPFMLALSQATTERLLQEALEAAGVTIERGASLIACCDGADGVTAELKHSGDGLAESVRCPWLLAADGAHSTIRSQMHVAFPGTSFQTPWHLADVSLATSLESDLAHIFFLDGGGFVFLIRVIDDISRDARGEPLWRMMSDRPDLLQLVDAAKPTAAPVWRSTFKISHRINDRLRAGNVCFAGDAAHIHSPVGARGMNLGLEDAWVLSRLVTLGEMHRYGHVRKRVDRQVVKRIELLSRMARGESAAARIIRTMIAPWLVRVPPVYDRVLRTVSGLDHALKLD